MSKDDKRSAIWFARRLELAADTRLGRSKASDGEEQRQSQGSSIDPASPPPLKPKPSQS